MTQGKMKDGTPDEIAQVGRQCRAIAYLATTIARVHEQKATMFEGGGGAFIVPVCGPDTAYIMEILGNILNNMDACSEEDAWLDPIFAEAQRRWLVEVLG